MPYRVALIAFLLFAASLPGQSVRAQSASGGAAACELALLLAIDVSGSVNRKEYRLQMGGLADALRSDEVIRLILSAAKKGVHIAVTQWSGQPHQQEIVPWMKITNEISISNLATRIERTERPFHIYSTAIGSALNHAREIFDRAKLGCRRQVIDVSGDGRSNEGISVSAMRDLLIQERISINGLVILGDDPDLKQYFRRNVIGGDGAFVIAVQSFRDYPAAIKKKLLREISPRITQGPEGTKLAQKAAAGEP